MRLGRYYLRKGYIFFLILCMVTVVCATPTTATGPHILNVVRVDYQAGRWHVVLTGSESMNYTATKASDPLRVVVDLPNTLSKTVQEPLVVDKGAIETIRTEQLVHEPQPLTRVEIGLNRDALYKITRRGEEIWISFNTVPPISKAEPSHIEPAAEAKAEISQYEMKTQTTYTPKSRPEQQLTDAKEPLPPASKIVAIEPVAGDEDVDVHIIGNGRLNNYDVFVLSDPPRLVLDLFGVRSTRVKGPLILDGPWVKRIRMGLHPNRLRVVFDLIVIPDAEVPYHIILEKDRLVVSFQLRSRLPSR